MKTLTLLRHAKSGHDLSTGRDFDRALNAKGRRAAAMMGKHACDLGLGFDHILASPALRVTETLDAFAKGFGQALSPAWDRRIYLASAVTLLELVQSVPADTDRLLLVGHNPGLEDLLLLLVPDDAGGLRDQAEAKVPTASIAVLTFEGEWADLRAGTAALTRFVRPRDLDPALGPDAE